MANHKYDIKKIEFIADTIVLELADRRGRPVFGFRPGQYVMISYKNLKGGMEDKHAFSIASSPSDTACIRLGIKVLGGFTQGLAKLKPGAEVSVSGPFGDFIFDEGKHRDVVMIAGGIGITPFLSAMKYATDNRLPNRLSLIYSNKTLASTLFYDEIKELEARNRNLRALFCVTEEKSLVARQGVVCSRISAPIIQNFLGSVDNKIFLTCGPLSFMNAIKDNLLMLGVNQERIEMEAFTMIPDAGFWAVMRNVSYAVGISSLLMLLPFTQIYGAALNPGANKNLGSLFSFANYDSAKLYALGRETYNQLLTGNVIAAQDEGVSFGGAAQLPAIENVASSSEATSPLEAIENTVADFFANLVSPKIGNNMPVVNVPAKTVATQNKQTAPKPTTQVSGAIHEIAAQPKQNSPTTISQAAPSPTTSVSAPAHVTAPIAPTTQTPSAAQTAAVPAPTTSVSAPAAANPVNGSVTATQSNLPATQPTIPAPTTAVSAPAGNTGTTSSTPSAPVVAASPTTTAPTPTTSASAPTNSGTISPSTSTTPTPVVQRSGRQGDDDDEHDD